MFDLLVSIIIPCYNQGQFLNETLESVFNQTYSNWECLIIDDGSTDNTEEIANDWINKDNRFIYCYKDNAGVSDTRNLGLQKAKGEFIQFLDSDDLISTNKISDSINAVKLNDVDIVCTNYLMFSKSVSSTEPPFSQLETFEFNFYNLARYWNSGFTVPIHCWFFKASLFEKIQFPVSLAAQEDWVVWLLVFKNSPKTFYIPQSLAFYRLNLAGRTQTVGFFDETLQAIAYLKPFLSEHEFNLLYQSVISRFNEGMLYWRNREINLKKSDTYQFGLLCKKVVKKIGLLPLAKSFFLYFKSSK
jgi:hypothetical protein